MQVTSPEPEEDRPKSPQEPQPQEDILVSSASIEMLSKLFPNKKRAVLELVLKRCNHDLLKAIEHFNLNTKSSLGETSTKDEQPSSSAFKPVGNVKTKLYPAHAMLPGSKVFMHSLYPFLPLFNPQPVLPSPVYVPGFCECEQCKHAVYGRVESRP